jgi:hypothetical protein
MSTHRRYAVAERAVKHSALRHASCGWRSVDQLAAGCPAVPRGTTVQILGVVNRLLPKSTEPTGPAVGGLGGIGGTQLDAGAGGDGTRPFRRPSIPPARRCRSLGYRAPRGGGTCDESSTAATSGIAGDVPPLDLELVHPLALSNGRGAADAATRAHGEAFDRSAWIGLTPFLMQGVRPRGCLPSHGCRNFRRPTCAPTCTMTAGAAGSGSCRWTQRACRRSLPREPATGCRTSDPT